MCPFEIGQLVVTIIRPETFDGLFNVPDVGQIVTIRDIFIGPYPDGNDISLRLVEIINSLAPGWSTECGFRWTCFRPVKPTSIEQLRELLINPLDGLSELVNDHV